MYTSVDLTFTLFSSATITDFNTDGERTVEFGNNIIITTLN